jgi:hypothetical protein
LIRLFLGLIVAVGLIVARLVGGGIMHTQYQSTAAAVQRASTPNPAFSGSNGFQSNGGSLSTGR